MINLNRSMDNKWILQKNISSSDLLEAFVSGMQNQNNVIDSEYLVNYLRNTNTYHGRSENGSTNTMGVRLSQACFYMFGFKKDGNFYNDTLNKMLTDDDINFLISITEDKIKLLSLIEK